MAGQKENEVKRDKFEIKLDEHVDFGAIASSKYITSNDLAKLTSELFKCVFADYEGALFEVNGNEPTMSLIFNHGEYAEGSVRACERVSSKTVGSTVIDRGRARDSLIKDGDRYYLTDDGKDVVTDLVVRRLYNNGNPDLRKVVSEFTDRGPVNSYFVQNQPQYTKVSYISLDRLCGLLFGTENEDGERYEYDVRIAAPINPGYNAYGGMSVSTNYVLNITRVGAKELSEFCNKIGLGASGIQIIR